MNVDPALLERVKSHVDRRRLLETAQALIEVPSPTGSAGAVSDCLAHLLTVDGFKVDRPSGGYPAAPAVAVRLESGAVGPALQFNGHLDTVHLPFAPPAVENGLLTGSGASDMKGGIAAAVEALRAIRDSGCLKAGSVLLTAHDLHEAPWGDGRQLNELIRGGIRGDAVLLPEPLCNVLPIAGRGSATWKAFIRRKGAAVHEVMRPRDEPSVIAAAAELIARLGRLESELATRTHPVCGAASVFVGQIHSGEIFNQFPHESWLEGTRRWLPDEDHHAVEADFRALLAQLGKDTRTEISCDWMMIRDAFALDRADPIVTAFQDVLPREHGLAAARGCQAVRRRRQQLLGPGGNSGDYTWTARRRSAHRLRVGRHRRLGPSRQAVCGHGRRILSFVKGRRSIPQMA